METLPEIPEFEVLSCIGYGARSTIYAVCETRTRQIYALKRVVRHSSDDNRFLQQVKQEYAISSRFDHPALRKSHRLIYRRKFLTITELHLLMDLFDGTALDVVRPSELQALLDVFCQVSQGLAMMHRMGYVHADIKPNNILINHENKCKIIDFGQSCKIGTVKTRIQGTPDYIAPEQVALGPLTPATDIFNFGASLYWCVTDHYVPTAISKKKNENDISAAAVRTLVPPHEINPHLPMALSQLILECVENRPSRRPPSMDAVYTRLQLTLSMSAAVRLNPTAERNGTTPAPSPASADTVT